MTFVMSKEDLRSWLGQLMEERTLIAPTSTDGLILFQQIARVEEVVLDFDNTVLPPKGCFFPATETLFTVQREDGRINLIPSVVARETVLFGLRPCDANGIALLDKPFLAEPSDTLYQQHRDKTILVGLSCNKVSPECFCTSVGGAPNDSSHLDILLTKIEEGCIIQAITERGKALLPLKQAPQTEAQPPSPPCPEVVPVAGALEVIRQVFGDTYWSRLADRCIHCNLCAYVCPTCYCFDVRDYEDGGRIERVRTWESCQSPGFTRIAGGYDPRSSGGARLRQRFYHKLLYFAEQFGAISCVGCGRCVKFCPVNIDIREVVRDIQSLGVKGGA
ncbi:MAG: 4Fe-4S dicluster domain-containing protein [Dehalococcoidia bacterium]|nr:4Fe-4S dicluster domain-containing protein [Dehalococcoidia bacterium]